MMDVDSMSLACTIYSRMRGLIGIDKYEGVLCLVPCSSIHTFGMRFSIDVAFVDESGIVLKAYRDVKPGTMLRQHRAACVLERMASARRSWFEEGDELQLGTVCESNTKGWEVQR